MRKVFRRTLTALLIVTCLLTATIVGAAIKTFDGQGHWHTSDAETAPMAMKRAEQRARLDAQKKAGVYLKTFSRSINSEFADDEISAVTNKIIEIVGDVHYDKKIIPLNDQQTTILYTATLKARIDTDGIYDWLKRDEKKRIIIIQQHNDLQDAIQKNDALAESLQEQYSKATTQAERDRILKQMNDADRDFLANQKLEEGNKVDYDGGGDDYRRAIKLYNEAIAIKPNYSKAYVARAGVYNFLGQHELEFADLNKAIEVEPIAKNYIHRAGFYGRKQAELALADYNKAIELEPIAKNYIHRAGFYGRKQAELALADYNKAIEIEPSVESFTYRSRFYKEHGKYDLALADLNKIIEIEPTAKSYLNRSEFYKDVLKDNELALVDLSKVIEVEPTAGSYIKRAWFYRDVLKNNDLAFADLNKAIEVEPTADSYIKRAWFYRDVLKNNELALADYNKAIELEPKFSSYTARAWFYKDLNNDELFISDLNKAIETEPTLFHYSWRSWVYTRMKKYELALADYDKIIELAPTFSNYAMRADCYKKLGKNDLALADYSKGIEVDPNVMSYLNRAGFYNDVLKNYELAIKDCNKAIKLLTTPQAGDTVAVDVNIYLGRACSLRGKAYYELKNYKSAVKEFNKAIELHPTGVTDAVNYHLRGKCYQALGEEAKAQADFAKAKELGYKG